MTVQLVDAMQTDFCW